MLGRAGTRGSWGRSLGPKVQALAQPPVSISVNITPYAPYSPSPGSGVGAGVLGEQHQVHFAVMKSRSWKGESLSTLHDTDPFGCNNNNNNNNNKNNGKEIAP